MQGMSKGPETMKAGCASATCYPRNGADQTIGGILHLFAVDCLINFHLGTEMEFGGRYGIN